MSWQGYIDTSLCGSGHIDKGAIVSLAGDSVWAASIAWHLKPHELKIISKIMNTDENGDQSAVAEAQAEGIYVAGERFVVARIDDGSLYARAGREGICICKTKQTIIIAHHPETAVAGNASSTVESLAEYLSAQGY